MTDTTRATEDVESYPRQAARTRGFRSGAPRAVTVSDDGGYVVFLRSGAGDDPANCLCTVTVADGTERVVADPRALLGDGIDQLSPAEQARRERMREVTSGIVGYSTDRGGTRVAFALSGRLYVIDVLGDDAPRQLDVAGPAVDPRVSPDGRWVAYVAADAVRVVGWDGSGDRVLAEPEAPTVTYGLADFVAAEELGRSRGLWWSPASDALLVERADMTDVATWWIADPVHPDRRPVEHRYPAAGTTNPAVSVHLLPLEGAGHEIAWDHEQFCYLADVSWTRHGDPLLVLLDRPQRRRQVLAVDVASHEARVVAEHDDPWWIDTAAGQVQWAPDGRLLAIDADYDTDTYRLTADSTPVSDARSNVVAVLDVGPRDLLVLLQTHSTRAKVAVLDLRTGRTERVTQVDAWETGRRGGRTVVVASTTWKSTRTTVTVHRGDGTTFELRSHAETPVTTPRLRPGSTLLLGGARELATAVLFPTAHEPGSARLPVVMSPYGGPGHAEVVAGLGHFGEQQWIADQGFAVVVADGRGTPGRGPTWERAIAGDLATVPLQDQVDALAAVLAEYPDDLDPTRVGIRGWSFGGFLAALAVLRRPDVFHAAVAGAPVTDWRLYDTAYTERYLGHPDEHPEAYDASSLLADAPTLTRPLLLIHGMTDDNVVVAHTLALSGRLTAAGRPHTVLPLSGVTHFTPDEVVTENRLRLELDFLRTHLDP
jgi:dipeptidyl-peptidase-4